MATSSGANPDRTAPSHGFTDPMAHCRARVCSSRRVAAASAIIRRRARPRSATAGLCSAEDAVHEPVRTPSSPPDLSGRVVLVTGATGGLGAPIARACAAAGATVVLHARVVRKLESLADAIDAAGHPSPILLPLDFASATAQDFSSVESALSRETGRLDAVIHMAAALGSLGPVEHQALDAWLDVLRVNVAAPMALTRAVVPLLRTSPAGCGRVILTLDTRSDAPRAYWGAYGASKAALAAFASTLADEWEHRTDLAVGAVVPGPIRSPLRMRTHPGEDRTTLPPPESIVPLYLHLLRDDVPGGVRLDAAAWLADQPASSSLLPAAAGGRA
jgi:NAD(P)-dependent dehydrogenase (short-subunit alcohol dehydrogenase family)